MINVNQDDIRRAASQLDALYTSMKCFVYYTEIKKKQDIEKQNTECWDFIEFTLLYTMLINWNEAFGISSQSNHWKEITFEQPEFTAKLYAAGNFTYQSWTDYRTYINDLSNSFISFPDPYHHKNQDYALDGIKASLEVTHDWLNGLLENNAGILSSDESEKWPIANKNHISDLKQQIQDALKNA